MPLAQAGSKYKEQLVPINTLSITDLSAVGWADDLLPAVPLVVITADSSSLPHLLNHQATGMREPDGQLHSWWHGISVSLPAASQVRMSTTHLWSTHLGACPSAPMAALHAATPMTAPSRCRPTSNGLAVLLLCHYCEAAK